MVISLIKKFRFFLNNSFYGPIIFLIFYFLFPFFFSIYFFETFKSSFFSFIFIFFILLLSSEALFLLLFNFINKSKYIYKKKIPFNKLIVEPDENLPFVYKKNFKSPPKELLNFPLHAKKFFSAQLTTNSLGFFNGEEGNREIVLPKPNGLIRINCIGASTTQNYLSHENKNYSYPLELERILKKKYNKKLEVNNFGTGGYTSLDLLKLLKLRLLNTEPDFVILYHAYNDIRSYLTPNFKPDYSHSRKSIGEIYHKFYISSKIPEVPINFFNYLINKWFPSNNRYALLESISKGEINLDQDITNGLKTFENNMQEIIDQCKNQKIKIILSTFCFNFHYKVQKLNIHKKYNEIVKEENKIIKDLANKNNLTLVDANLKIPKENSNFVDTIHFTPKGMSLLAYEISKSIDI